MLEGKKISELDQIDTLSLGSSFPVLDKGATKRIAFSALLNKIENELPESDIDKVKDDVEKLKVKTESINTLTAEMEAVKDQVSGVDEMVQGQNATIRNCVSAVEGLEQVIETTHFDDVLALEEQVHANTSGIAQNAANIELKQNLLNENQLKAINSGITAEKVALIPNSAVAQIDDNSKDAMHAWSGAKVAEEIEFVDNKNNYSTEETVIGKWIDGKPIYRKVFIDPTESWDANDKIIGNITNFKEPVSIKAIAVFDYFPGWVENNEAGYAYIKSNGEVHLYSNGGGDGLFYPKKIIIEYTKTTD